MQSFRKPFHLLVGQILCFLFFIWYYLQYSFLRPCVDKGIDCVMALLLVVTMAINFWIIYPLVYKRYSFLTYLVIVLAESLIINLLEYTLTSKTVLELYSSIIQQEETIVTTLLPIYGNTFLRDVALMIVVGLVADNIRLTEKQVENDQELLRSSNQLVAKNQGRTCVIEVSKIYLCRQERNYATLYAVDGQLYRKRTSLKDLEYLLKERQFIRISKSDIIGLSAIKRCEGNLVLFKEEIVTKTKAVAISRSYLESTVPIILRYLDHVIQTEPISDVTSKKAEQVDIPEKKTNRVNQQKAYKIQQYISSHQGCKIDEIVSGTKVPKSTVTRYLRELQIQNLIEYVGSKKTGGYRIVEHGE